MANSKLVTLTDRRVAFGVVAGKGRKGKKEENEFALAVEVSAKERKALLKDLNELFEDNKGARVKKPSYAFEDWFTDSKDVKDGFVFWASEAVSKGITRKVAAGTGYGMKEFEGMGNGSTIDAEYRFFFFSNKYGEGLGLRLSAVLLKEFKAYAGAGGSSLGGEELQDDGTQVAAEEDPTLDEFLEAIEDEDYAEGKDLLKSLRDHEDYKKFKKMLKDIK